MNYQNIQIIVVRFVVLLSLLTFSCQKPAKENIHVNNLRCELLVNPLGIDVINPHLSWEISSEQRNIIQKAYQILVASSLDKLNANDGDLWNSGRIESDQSIHVKYEGKELKSFTSCFWKVKIWSANGESDWSTSASWSMGMLHFKDWKGRWIGLDRSFPWDSETKFSRLSARYFRKEFKTSGKQIQRASIYIIGLGQYKLYLNGQQVGDQVLSPSPTDYTKNVKYNSFDVTNSIHSGANAIGVILGNGYFYTMRQKYKPYKIKTFGYPKLLLNLFIEYTDGTRQVLITDNSWKVTADGPIRSNNLYDGEEYNATKEMPGWSSINFNDSNWLQAEFVQPPGGEYHARMNENMKVMDTIQPVSITKLKGDRYILDLGQNMAGWLRMKVRGKSGDKITLKFAESLQENGELFRANLRDAKATDVYALNGQGEETWEPSFIYHGFRYIEISGYPGTPEIKDFEGCVVYDNIQTTGMFETSDSLINQIYKNAFWSMNSTYKGMPIDCPQRNERMPWLGDRAVGCYNESYVMDNSRLYTKWLDDIMFSQKADGCIPDVAPPFFRYYSDNMTWPGTYILVAEMLYHQYGLTDPIRKHYPYMNKWLLYMKDQYLKNFILIKDSYGDWCPPPKTIEEGRGKSADVKRPSQLISTAYFYHYLHVMRDFALLTGNRDDIGYYSTLADSVKVAFNRSFFNKENSSYGNNTLTDNILPLYFGLVPVQNKKELNHRIRDIILVENNGHLSSGLIGMQWLMRSLGDNGLQDVAFKIATSKTYPGWGYMIENGATTIWELWNANTAAPNMNSQNHVMLLGDLIIWFYENLAGIKSSKEYPGFKQIIMKPEFDVDLDSVNASYHSVYGLIRSHWKKENNKIYWNVEIPANTSAIIHFPTNKKKNITEKGENISSITGVRYLGLEEDKIIFIIGSGNYYFEINR